jgi:hypothetical protein
VEQVIVEFQKLCEDYLHLERITASPLPQKYPPVYDLGKLDRFGAPKISLLLSAIAWGWEMEISPI